MPIVVIHNWPDAGPELIQRVAAATGQLAFEVRQRMLGGGPVVIAKFADAGAAEDLRVRLGLAEVPALVFDERKPSLTGSPFPVRHFSLGADSIRLGTAAGKQEDLRYETISLIIAATTVVSHQETTISTTERKFSLGKTVLAGGLPMTRKVTKEVSTSSEERDELLAVFAAGESRFYHFFKSRLDYSGLGERKQLTRDLNFNTLRDELRRRAPQASYDDRLLKRAGLARLLGTSFDPDDNLGLACEILALTLR